jgi:hypothetical protein
MTIAEMPLVMATSTVLTVLIALLLVVFVGAMIVGRRLRIERLNGTSPAVERRLRRRERRAATRGSERRRSS